MRSSANRLLVTKFFELKKIDKQGYVCLYSEVMLCVCLWTYPRLLILVHTQYLDELLKLFDKHLHFSNFTLLGGDNTVSEFLNSWVFYVCSFAG